MVSIIIVTYNSNQFLLETIKSIYNIIKSVEFEIIVWDNASSLPPVSTSQFPFDVYIGDQNEGFGSGCNKGSEKAKGDFLLFLNPDAILLNDKLKDFCNILNDGDVGIIGCAHYDGSFKITKSSRSFPDLKSAFCNLFFLNALFPQSKIFGDYEKTWFSHLEKSTIDVVGGAFLLIKRDLFEKICGFDERFFLYTEETDLCYRLNSLGYKVLFNPEMKIQHFQGKSTPNSFTSVRNLFVSENLFVKLHHRKIYWIIFILVNLLNKLNRAFICFLFGIYKNDKSQVEKGKLFFKASIWGNPFKTIYFKPQ